MQELTPSSAEEDLFLERELDKLFALQDRPLAKEKRSILVTELMGTGIPLRAILSGLRSLLNEDLNKITFPVICAAARKFFEQESVQSCEECLSGMIVMKDEQGRMFSLACRCAAGLGKVRTQVFVQWKGEDTQFSKGRLLKRA